MAAASGVPKTRTFVPWPTTLVPVDIPSSTPVYHPSVNIELPQLVDVELLKACDPRQSKDLPASSIYWQCLEQIARELEKNFNQLTQDKESFLEVSSKKPGTAVETFNGPESDLLVAVKDQTLPKEHRSSPMKASTPSKRSNVRTSNKVLLLEKLAVDGNQNVDESKSAGRRGLKGLTELYEEESLDDSISEQHLPDTGTRTSGLVNSEKLPRHESLIVNNYSEVRRKTTKQDGKRAARYVEQHEHADGIGKKVNAAAGLAKQAKQPGHKPVGSLRKKEQVQRSPTRLKSTRGRLKRHRVTGNGYDFPAAVKRAKFSADDQSQSTAVRPSTNRTPFSIFDPEVVPFEQPNTGLFRFHVLSEFVEFNANPEDPMLLICLCEVDDLCANERQDFLSDLNSVFLGRPPRFLVPTDDEQITHLRELSIGTYFEGHFVDSHAISRLHMMALQWWMLEEPLKRVIAGLYSAVPSATKVLRPVPSVEGLPDSACKWLTSRLCHLIVQSSDVDDEPTSAFFASGLLPSQTANHLYQQLCRYGEFLCGNADKFFSQMHAKRLKPGRTAEPLELAAKMPFIVTKPAADLDDDDDDACAVVDGGVEHDRIKPRQYRRGRLRQRKQHRQELELDDDEVLQLNLEDSRHSPHHVSSHVPPSDSLPAVTHEKSSLRSGHRKKKIQEDIDDDILAANVSVKEHRRKKHATNHSKLIQDPVPDIDVDNNLISKGRRQEKGTSNDVSEIRNSGKAVSDSSSAADNRATPDAEWKEKRAAEVTEPLLDGIDIEEQLDYDDMSDDDNKPEEGELVSDSGGWSEQLKNKTDKRQTSVEDKAHKSSDDVHSRIDRVSPESRRPVYRSSGRESSVEDSPGARRRRKESSVEDSPRARRSRKESSVESSPRASKRYRSSSYSSSSRSPKKAKKVKRAKLKKDEKRSKRKHKTRSRASPKHMLRSEVQSKREKKSKADVLDSRRSSKQVHSEREDIESSSSEAAALNQSSEAEAKAVDSSVPEKKPVSFIGLKVEIVNSAASTLDNVDSSVEPEVEIIDPAVMATLS